ncbi:MAG TPA: caspase family protein [Flavisolibacter sp.]
MLACAQNKRALIVAVGNYMPESGIAPLSSLNDVKYITAVLENHDFQEKNIRVLPDKAATHAAILKALDDLARTSSKGDIVLIHFSGHGQQIRDQRTAEAGKDEDDGYDEAFLPYDVKKPQYYPGVYTGENHLRDDELGMKLIALRNKLGATGSLLVLIDACHSGTATRSASFTTARGEPVPFMDPENPVDANTAATLDDSFFSRLAGDAANMVVISGSGPHQQNFQTELSINGSREEIGSLTYAFYRAMNELPAGADYELLFRKIRAMIQAHHPNQIPMVEGNTSQLVFQGKFQSGNASIPLTTTDHRLLADTIFKIPKGLTDGVAPGTTLDIFDASGKTVAEGVIRRADYFAAFGAASQLLQRGESYHAVPRELSWGTFGVSVALVYDAKDREAAAVKDEVVRSLQAFPFIFTGSTGELLLRINRTETGWHLALEDAVAGRWQSAWNTSPAANDMKPLLKSIASYMRVKFLRTLPDGGQLARNVRVEIIPGSSGVATDDPQLVNGDGFALNIYNNGRDRLFYTVIDLTPDQRIDILYPVKGKNPADYSIERNSTISRRLAVSRNTPAGKEYLKVIVSKEPLDLHSVLDHSRQRSDMTSFLAAMDDLFRDDRATRGEISAIRAEEVGIVTVSFTVKGP